MLSVLAEKTLDALARICLELPTHLSPGAIFQCTLNDEIGTSARAQTRQVILLEIRL